MQQKFLYFMADGQHEAHVRHSLYRLNKLLKVASLSSRGLNNKHVMCENPLCVHSNLLCGEEEEEEDGE